MIGNSGHQAGRPEGQLSWPPSSPDDNSIYINSRSNNEDTSASSSTSEEKYGLRPRTLIKRLQQEQGRQQVAKGSKGLARPKSKPAPLSKYRRKTANARERHRMREINNAFESLRRMLPDELEVEAASPTMTKISTLRLAASYIRALSSVLHQEGGDAFCSLPCAAPTPLLRVASAPPRHLLDYFAPVSDGATSASRGSLSSSSCSDLDDLLSDDSCSLLDDSFDVFHDIPSLPHPDPLELLLGEERDALAFSSDLCI